MDLMDNVLSESALIKKQVDNDRGFRKNIIFKKEMQGRISNSI